MINFFPKLFLSGGNLKVELNLFNYATKADSKNATGVDGSGFAKWDDLASLKAEFDILDIGKSQTT